MKISFALDGRPIEIETDGNIRLLDSLREDFDITGIKEGCGQGECGACTIFFNNKIANACMIPMFKVQGCDVYTIEGFGKTERFNVLKQAYIDAGAVQCGFCTPGMIMASEAILRVNSNPSEEAIRQGLSGNLCRCTGYEMIVKAVRLAADRGRGKW